MLRQSFQILVAIAHTVPALSGVEFPQNWIIRENKCLLHLLFYTVFHRTNDEKRVIRAFSKRFPILVAMVCTVLAQSGGEFPQNWLIEGNKCLLCLPFYIVFHGTNDEKGVIRMFPKRFLLLVAITSTILVLSGGEFRQNWLIRGNKYLLCLLFFTIFCETNDEKWVISMLR